MVQNNKLKRVPILFNLQYDVRRRNLSDLTWFAFVPQIATNSSEKKWYSQYTVMSKASEESVESLTIKYTLRKEGRKELFWKLDRYLLPILLWSRNHGFQRDPRD